MLWFLHGNKVTLTNPVQDGTSWCIGVTYPVVTSADQLVWQACQTGAEACRGARFQEKPICVATLGRAAFVLDSPLLISQLRTWKQGPSAPETAAEVKRPDSNQEQKNKQEGMETNGIDRKTAGKTHFGSALSAQIKVRFASLVYSHSWNLINLNQYFVWAHLAIIYNIKFVFCAQTVNILTAIWNEKFQQCLSCTKGVSHFIQFGLLQTQTSVTKPKQRLISLL